MRIKVNEMQEDAKTISEILRKYQNVIYGDTGGNPEWETLNKAQQICISDIRHSLKMAQISLDQLIDLEK